jgi:hypothetical protein
MSDHDFDAMSLKVNPDILTGNLTVDNFFQTQFKPETGMWIHHHPEKEKLGKLYETHFRKPPQGLLL